MKVKDVTLAFAGLVVLLFSAPLCYRHLHSLVGNRTLVTWFHIINAAFCACYGIYELVLFLIPGICQCDPVNVLKAIYLVLYAAMVAVFYRYWQRAVGRAVGRDEPAKWWWVAAYSSTSGAYLAYFVAASLSGEKGCTFSPGAAVRLMNCLLALNAVMLLDSLHLAVVCALALRDHYTSGDLFSKVSTSKYSTRKQVTQAFSVPCRMIVPHVICASGFPVPLASWLPPPRPHLVLRECRHKYRGKSS